MHVADRDIHAERPGAVWRVEHTTLRPRTAGWNCEWNLFVNLQRQHAAGGLGDRRIQEAHSTATAGRGDELEALVSPNIHNVDIRVFGRLTDETQDRIDFVVLDSYDNRRITAFEEAAGRIDPSGAEFVVDQQVDKLTRIFVASDANDEFHRGLPRGKIAPCARFRRAVWYGSRTFNDTPGK